MNRNNTSLMKRINIRDANAPLYLYQLFNIPIF
nr:MAG TPA_asm: hypothetical protein [Caudoviricetes sp.]